ncbi:MAG: transposase, partial [Candidatus Zophobacter franzmannii]|nr:transposase [Candidatus Zophobacter franzmannii]
MKDKNVFTHNMQVNLHKKVKKVTSGLTKPEQRNLFSIILGILLSGSCIMRQIAESLPERTSKKKTTDRLRVHLSKEYINKSLVDNFLMDECRKIGSDDLIIVDPSDLAKKYAKKMENLTTVHDGSTGKLVNGYQVFDIVRLSQEGDKVRLHPLVSEIHGHDDAPGAMKRALFDYLNDIIVYSNNRGIYVMDRGYDDKVVLNYLHENDAAYIIRSVGSRNLYYNGKEMNFKLVAKKAKLKYTIKSGKAVIKAGVVRVGIPVDSHHKKNATLVYSNLVVAKYINKDKYTDKDLDTGGYSYIFCNFTDREMCDYEIVTKALISYRKRWKIEEVHRHF